MMSVCSDNEGDAVCEISHSSTLWILKFDSSTALGSKPVVQYFRTEADFFFLVCQLKNINGMATF